MSKTFLLFLSFFTSCYANDQPPASKHTAGRASYKTIENIPIPSGYKRIELPAHSFGEWLRKLPLKSDNRVFLYNGTLKADQSVQFAVLDIPVGTKDLQQCADAIMRLRMEYLVDKQKSDSISFLATNGQHLSFADWKKGMRYKLVGNRLVAYQSGQSVPDARKALETYMEFVFSYAGTISLQKQLAQKKKLTTILPGDVFIKAGSPGHAMLVVDVAMNNVGQRVFMLAQSYMPAQDIHVVRNSGNGLLQPWYGIDESSDIVTPEWTFGTDQLQGWE